MSALPVLQFPSGGEEPGIDIPTKAEENSFRDYLAEQCSFEQGLLTIGEVSYHASDILKGLDPEAYSNALIAFRDEREGQLADLVTQWFPSPIAYCFYMFVNGAENQHERLQFLRDSWEALVRFTHALVVSEARTRQIDLRQSGLSFSQLFSDSINQILNNIETTLSFVNLQGAQFSSSEIFDDNFIARLRALNHLRNDFSHSQTLSAIQTAELIDESIEEFFPLLWSLERLRDIQLLRATVLQGNELRVQTFIGYSQLRRTTTITLAPKTIADSYLLGSMPRFVPEHLLASVEDQFFCLAPFVHFQISATGHHPKILLLKKARTINERKLLLYEILGESQPTSLDRAQFKPHLDELRACFGLDEES